jgi:subtilisin family serine protease
MAIIDPASNPQGCFLGVLDPEYKDEFLKKWDEILNNPLVHSSAIDGDGEFHAHPDTRCVLFDKLDVLVIDGGVKGNWKRYFSHLEPERRRRAPTPPVGLAMETAKATECLRDEPGFTWGLKATGLAKTSLTGKNIKVGILDSGLDFKHEAFRGHAQSFTRRSFVTTPVDKDELGHGTACAGVLCGQPDPANNQRIGVAPEVDLVVAKIFDTQKVSPDTRTLAAVDWAISQGCSIISMSIGDQILPAGGFSEVFEAAALAAMKQKVLLVAGAGNNSRRSMMQFEPVDHPANCPSIMAVGALDRCLDVAEFSNRSLMGNGGEIDLAAPGRSIRVAAAEAVMERYTLKQGTSFAVPFVAGIAALWMQSSSQLSGTSLWKKLVDTARELKELDRRDVGDGLVQGPPASVTSQSAASGRS